MTLVTLLKFAIKRSYIHQFVKTFRPLPYYSPARLLHMCLRLTVSCKDRKISNRNGNLALVVQKGGKPYSGNKSIDFGGIYPLGDYNFIYLSFEQLGPGVQEHNSSLKRLNGYRSKRAFLSFKTFLVIAIKISTKYQFLCDTTHGRNDSPKQNANEQHLKFNELL